MKRSFALTGCFLFLLLAVTLAQAPISYTVKIVLVGATQPITTATIPATAFVCGQTKISVPTGVVLNPNSVAFDDPLDSTKDCIYTDPGSGPLLALPFGTQEYFAKIAVTNSAGTSADATSVNTFSHPGVVANAATGVRVIKR